MLSAHVEIETAIDLLESGRGIGYLLKSRVMRVDDVVDALGRISAGGSVVDPALVQELVAQRHRNDPLDDLTPREREVLALMAEGHSNSGIAARLVVTEGAVEKHVRSIMAKLRLPATADAHRRVLAVLAFLSLIKREGRRSRRREQILRHEAEGRCRLRSDPRDRRSRRRRSAPPSWSALAG